MAFERRHHRLSVLEHGETNEIAHRLVVVQDERQRNVAGHASRPAGGLQCRRVAAGRPARAVRRTSNARGRELPDRAGNGFLHQVQPAPRQPLFIAVVIIGTISFSRWP